MTLSRRPLRAVLASTAVTLTAAVAAATLSAPLAAADAGLGSLGRPAVPDATSPTTPTDLSPGFRDGALSDLTVAGDLTCGVISPSDRRSEFASAEACATLVSVDGRTFGSTTVGLEEYEPLAQTVSGAGTVSDPRVIRTVVGVGAADTGLTLTQVDRFVDGAAGYLTDITVDNASGGDRDVKVYRAVDCLSDGTDGTGAVYGRSVACHDEAGRGIAFTDTASDDLLDNGMGINWSVSVPAGGSVALRSRFQLDEPID